MAEVDKSTSDLMDAEGRIFPKKQTGSNSALIDGLNAREIDNLADASLLYSFEKRLRAMQKDLPAEYMQIVDDHFFDLLA